VKRILPWLVVILTGITVLSGYFLAHPILQQIRTIMLDIAITLAGIATIVGVINLITIHARKVRDEKPDWFNSVVLIVAFAGTTLFGLIFKPSHPIFTQLVASIQFPVEASLLALLSITLAAAMVRAIRPGMNRASLVFIAAVLVFMWAATGFIPFQNSKAMQSVASFLNTLQIGGARGMLLGIGLGALTAGLRVLIGKDIPAGK
jgi:hypothetical protein